jgi:hypothetical protein
MQIGHVIIDPNKIYRAARAITLIALAATAVIGVLHTKLGRPLLAKLGGCPVQSATQDDLERIRHIAVAQNVTDNALAPARVALGFKLDVTTDDEVHAWASKNSVSCDDDTAKGQIICKDVPGKFLGDDQVEPVEELTFAFSAKHQLVNLLALRHGLDSTRASKVFLERRGRLEKEIGPPSHSAGETSPEFFDQDILRTAIVDYRYKDYEAEVSATTMFDRKITVREHYFSAL